MTSDPARSTPSALLRGLVVDVPDFPEPGVVFKDITPLLADHDGFAAVVEALAAAGRDDAGHVRRRQGRRHGGARVHPRRAGRAGPRRRLRAGPQGRQAAARDARGVLRPGVRRGDPRGAPRRASQPGDRVLLVDDVLATGGTVAATRQLVETCGAVAHAVAVLMELSFLPGREAIGDLPLTSLMTV